MRIREATIEDAPRLVEMATRFLLNTRYGPMFDNAATPETIGTLIEDVLQLGTIFVAEVWPERPAPQVRHIVGMLAIVVLPHPLTGRAFAEEIAWWVEPEHRGGSIGPKLLWYAERWATTKGAKMCKMVAPTDTMVGKFYERMGYEAVETAYIKLI